MSWADVERGVAPSEQLRIGAWGLAAGLLLGAQFPFSVFSGRTVI